MTERTETLTVLFADVCDSTGLLRRHGDHQGHEIIQFRLESVASIVIEHDGWVVDRIGDELMCAMPDAGEAILAALAIQDRSEAAAVTGDPRLGVRMHVGLHHGQVLIDGDQVYGTTVHTAKRMVEMAKADQIFTTQDTLAAAGELPGVQSRGVDEVVIKGQERPIAIVEVLREGTALTVMPTTFHGSISGERYSSCTLRFRDQYYRVDATRPSLTIGRLETCHLVIQHTLVSREHARLEYQKGRIVFIDHSTNGTFVNEDAAADMILVHREQRWLRKRGLLRIGHRNDPNDELTLTYTCETIPS